jgi:hypothetical protein
MFAYGLQDWSLLWEQPKSCWQLVVGVVLNKCKGLDKQLLIKVCGDSDGLKTD